MRAPERSAAARFSEFRDLSGALPPPQVGAVELINVIRPTVAVARYVAFEALALHRYPDAPTDDIGRSSEEASWVFRAEMRYRVPDQDLRVSLSRMPAQPRSRFIIRDVQRVS